MKAYNLVIPLAGKGSRMLAGGFKLPKPMLIAGNKSVLEWSMASIDYSNCNLIFIVRKEHVDNFVIDSWLKSLWVDARIVVLDKETSGAVETVYEGLKDILFSEPRIYHPNTEYFDANAISPSIPLIIYCPDTTFSPKYSPSETDFEESHGLILSFKANSPNYSYLKVDKKNNVLETREKEVISNVASVGVYGFSETQTFMAYAYHYIRNGISKEKHVCPIYNEYIKNGTYIKHKHVDSVHVMGTPEEFNFFEKVSFPFFLPRKFVLCSDHSGFEAKQHMIGLLKDRGIDFLDVGCFSAKDCDYNPYVGAAVRVIQNNQGYFGLGFCRTGQGVNICANKYPDINSCLVTDSYYAEHAIKHNAGNFFCIPDLPKEELAIILRELLNSKFEGGRHQLRMMNNAN